MFSEFESSGRRAKYVSASEITPVAMREFERVWPVEEALSLLRMTR
ncbi:hypothetical protein [Pseudoclavibacter terrae]|nr:hypothetical protein [Pseudoclavibacter terrae]